LIEALRRRVPTLVPKPAELRVGVMLQMVQGMVRMYNDAEPSERSAVIQEFKTALASYLSTVFDQL
jgi:hypothetical protein